MAATELDRLVRGRWRMLSGGYDGVVFGASWSCGISWDWVREKRLGSAIYVSNRHDNETLFLSWVNLVFFHPTASNILSVILLSS